MYWIKGGQVAKLLLQARARVVQVGGLEKTAALQEGSGKTDRNLLPCGVALTKAIQFVNARFGKGDGCLAWRWL